VALARAALVALAIVALAPTAALADPGRKVVVLDPGHNGRNAANPGFIDRQVWAGGLWKPCDTIGARTANGYTEAAHNWDVALRLRKILIAADVRVVMTRTDNRGVGPCITRRTTIGNRAKADLAVSLHADQAPARVRGFHVIVPKSGSGTSRRVERDSVRLGVHIRNALRRDGPTPVAGYWGRGGIVYRDDLGGLNLSTVPKVFVEAGNMGSPEDAAILESPEGRQAEAEAIATGILRYLRFSRR
jgi:N-acetylmuramoyl-L-alanine amidase